MLLLTCLLVCLCVLAVVSEQVFASLCCATDCVSCVVLLRGEQVFCVKRHRKNVVVWLDYVTPPVYSCVC